MDYQPKLGDIYVTRNGRKIKIISIEKGKLKTVQGVWLPDHPDTVIGGDKTHPKHAIMVCTTGDGEKSFHNSNFIAAAQDAIPKLIGVLSRVNIDIQKLKEENEALKKEVSELRGDNCCKDGSAPCQICIKCARDLD